MVEHDYFSGEMRPRPCQQHLISTISVLERQACTAVLQWGIPTILQVFTTAAKQSKPYVNPMGFYFSCTALKSSNRAFQERKRGWSCALWIINNLPAQSKSSLLTRGSATKHQQSQPKARWPLVWRESKSQKSLYENIQHFSWLWLNIILVGTGRGSSLDTLLCPSGKMLL